MMGVPPMDIRSFRVWLIVNVIAAAVISVSVGLGLFLMVYPFLQIGAPK